MFVKKSLLLLCTVFVFCESVFVDTLSKCDINDSACTKDLIQSVLKDFSKTGMKELGIPPFDPMELKNVSIAVLDILDITLIEGTLKGPKDCIITRFEADVENERAFLDLACDLTIKGRYKVYSNSPLVKSFTGGETLSGEGNGKVQIDKLYLKLDFGFYIQKRNDELYIKCKPNKFKYSFDIKGKMLFFADELYIGKQESSKLVTGLLNENWRSMISTFGKPFMDKACKEFLLVFLHNFFGNVPVRYYITTDLSKYAREE